MLHKCTSFLFQSTLPARGSDKLAFSVTSSGLYFNPRSPRGGATPIEHTNTLHRYISIHAPREGERPSGLSVPFAFCLFQSTLPARGSDVAREIFNPVDGAISIHAPREGERPKIDGVEYDQTQFQSTLPARGSDLSVAKKYRGSSIFQSTLPARGSDPLATFTLVVTLAISIHAPREGERPTYGA